MHQMIRLTLASLISGVSGWVFMAITSKAYVIVVGQNATLSSPFTTFNWIASTIISAIIFVYSYIKITNWIEG
jgi:hypothetical protein